MPRLNAAQLSYQLTVAQHEKAAAEEELEKAIELIHEMAGHVRRYHDATPSGRRRSDALWTLQRYEALLSHLAIKERRRERSIT